MLPASRLDHRRCQGLGRASAEAMLDNGAHVTCVRHDRACLDRTVTELRGRAVQSKAMSST